jgi:hypothetical protein
MPMVKLRFSALTASIVLSVSGACQSSPDADAGALRAEAKSGDMARAGSGRKSGGAGNQSKPVDTGKPSVPVDAGATIAADGGMTASAAPAPSTTAGSGAKAGSGGEPRGPAAAGSGGSIATTPAPGSGSADPSASAELFDQSSVVRFDITLPQASIDALGTAPDVYTHAGLRYRDMTFADVGVRIKGESSRRTLMQKAAFKIKIDEYVANQTLLGMKRITLNNMLSDDTYMAECLAYHVWRAAMLPAPRCNHAVVYVNDTYYGVYAHVESEDKAFLRRWFANDDGNLYEDGMADFVNGAESSFDLQTNETANDRSDLIALIGALDSASSATYLQDLDAVLDTAQFLRYSAMEAAVNQWDGYSYTYFEPNNFRIYHDPTTRKLSFIPWGHDLSMKAFAYVEADRPAREYIPLFTRPLYENRTGARDSGGRIFVGDRIGLRAQGGCMDSDTCRNAFAEAVREVIAVYDGANLPALAEQTYELIRPHIYEETTRREVSNEQFEAAYQTLLQFIAGRTAALRDDLTAAGFTP